MDLVSIPSIPAASFPLPPRLEGLRRLAYNLRWAWNPRTRNLWSLIDRTAWDRYRNAIPVISGPTDWSRLLEDEKFMAEYQDVLAEFDRYMANGAGHWFQRKYGDKFEGQIVLLKQQKQDIEQAIEELTRTMTIVSGMLKNREAVSTAEPITEAAE